MTSATQTSSGETLTPQNDDNDLSPTLDPTSNEAPSQPLSPPQGTPAAYNSRQNYIPYVGVDEVWNHYTGAGIKIAILDQGIQYTHSDLNDNYDTSADYDFYGNDETPLPGYFQEGHGTAVAGIIAAEDNGEGIVGVAYNSTIASIRGDIGAPFAMSWENRHQFTRKMAEFDVANNSYGLSTNAMYNDAEQGFVGGNSEAQKVESDLEYVVQNGRGGLGTNIVFSAGNNRSKGYETNADNQISSRYTLTVSAIDYLRVGIAGFSAPGSAILTATPGESIYTTNASFPYGYEAYEQGYTYFDGTSASAPIATGVIALMLEANANLGYRDVQQIVALSSRQVDATNDQSQVWTAYREAYRYGNDEVAWHYIGNWQENGASNWNGGGMHTSRNYGFGAMDAAAAVRLAESWTKTSTASNETSVSQSIASPLTLIDRGEVSQSINVSSNLDIEFVEVVVDIEHTFIGDLIITLVSPDGTESVLVNRPGKNALYWAEYDKNQDPDNLRRNFGLSSDNLNYKLTSGQFRGENGTGEWTLKIRDAAGQDTGVLKSWDITLYGSEQTNNNTYFFTDEFTNFSGSDLAARSEVSDNNGGNDTINGAALTEALTLDLTGATTSSIHNTALHVAQNSDIENAIGGKGDDQITGTHVDNTLNGADGNDVLFGNRGDDTLIGGRGDDRLNGGQGADHLNGGEGTDTAQYDTLQRNIFLSYDELNDYWLAKDNETGAVDRLINVEQVQFTDRTITLNTQIATEQAAIRLHKAETISWKLPASGGQDGSDAGTDVTLTYQILDTDGEGWFNGDGFRVRLTDATAGTYDLEVTDASTAQDTSFAYQVTDESGNVTHSHVRVTLKDPFTSQLAQNELAGATSVVNVTDGDLSFNNPYRWNAVSTAPAKSGDFKLSFETGKNDPFTSTNTMLVIYDKNEQHNFIESSHTVTYAFTSGYWIDFHYNRVGYGTHAGGQFSPNFNVGDQVRIERTNGVLTLFKNDAQIYQWDQAFSDNVNVAFVGATTNAPGQFNNVTWEYPDTISSDGNDYLTSATPDTTLHGEAGDDVIVGSDGHDTLYGDDGNDTLSGGTGNNILYGGSGTDTASYDKAQHLYALTYNANSQQWSVKDRETGTTDTLNQFEFIKFSDTSAQSLTEGYAPSKSNVIIKENENISWKLNPPYLGNQVEDPDPLGTSYEILNTDDQGWYNGDGFRVQLQSAQDGHYNIEITDYSSPIESSFAYKVTDANGKATYSEVNVQIGDPAVRTLEQNTLSGATQFCTLDNADLSFNNPYRWNAVKTSPAKSGDFNLSFDTGPNHSIASKNTMLVIYDANESHKFIDSSHTVTYAFTSGYWIDFHYNRVGYGTHAGGQFTPNFSAGDNVRIERTNGILTLYKNDHQIYQWDTAFKGNIEVAFVGASTVMDGAFQDVTWEFPNALDLSGDDALHGTNTADTIRGESGNDDLHGNAGDDTLYGGDGNDSLTGGLGDDLLVGGNGGDTAIFHEERDNYQLWFNHNSDQWHVKHTSTGEVDRVDSVEYLHFSDTPITLSSLAKAEDSFVHVTAGDIEKGQLGSEGTGDTYYKLVGANSDGRIYGDGYIITMIDAEKGTYEINTSSQMSARTIEFEFSVTNEVSAARAATPHSKSYGKIVVDVDKDGETILRNRDLSGATEHTNLNQNDLSFTHSYFWHAVKSRPATDGDFGLSFTTGGNTSVSSTNTMLVLYSAQETAKFNPHTHTVTYSFNTGYWVDLHYNKVGYGANQIELFKPNFNLGDVVEIRRINNVVGLYQNNTLIYQWAEQLSGQAEVAFVGASTSDHGVFKDVTWDYAARALDGGAFNDLLSGDRNIDIITAQGGDDTLIGNQGNDTLTGGQGDDTYIVDRQSDADVIDNRGEGSAADKVLWGTGIDTDQLWFEQMGEDLRVSVIGTQSNVLIEDWYLNNGDNHVATFELADGSILEAVNVQNLVNAMATFDRPLLGQTELTDEQHAALDDDIAANWSPEGPPPVEEPDENVPDENVPQDGTDDPSVPPPAPVPDSSGSTDGTGADVYTEPMIAPPSPDFYY